jgi:hypothetical protein
MRGHLYEVYGTGVAGTGVVTQAALTGAFQQLCAALSGMHFAGAQAND